MVPACAAQRTWLACRVADRPAGGAPTAALAEARAGQLRAGLEFEAERLAERLRAEGKEVVTFISGRKGEAYYRFRNRPVRETWTGFSDQPRYENARDIGESLIGAFVADTDAEAAFDALTELAAQLCIDLQPREYRLLEYLMRHAGQVVTRTMLLESVWDYHFDPQTNVIDVHISRLRAKIDKGFDAQLLHTVRGAGYMIRDGAR